MSVKCPRCFHTLNNDLFVWECIGTCKAHPDPAASALAGLAQECRTLVMDQRKSDNRRWQPTRTEDVSCPECGQGVREVCPLCHTALLPGWRQGTTVCIALGGARATGKSIYLGVVIKQLEQLLSEHGSALRYGNEITRRTYAGVYEQPLYLQRGIMGSTRRVGTEVTGTYQSNPLIFTFELPRTGRVFLVFRDVAGEDLEDPQGDQTHLSYFQRADTALFLFDPSAVAEIRELLRDYLPAQLNRHGDPERAFDTMLELIGPAPVPIGMVLSKFDTMQALREVNDEQWRPIMVNPGSALNRDPGLYPPGYDRDDGAQVHEETRSLLHLLHARKLLNSVSGSNRARESRFFVVSALGEPAQETRLHSRGITPYRCLDPIRWALSSRSAF